MLEDDPAGYPPAVAAQRVSGIELGLLAAALSQQSRKTPPRQALAGMMAQQAQDIPMIMDCGKPMILESRVCTLLRHACARPYCRAF